MLRNHASLALWCGGNEQHPAEDLNDALTKNIVIVDPEFGNPSRSLDGTRLYIEGCPPPLSTFNIISILHSLKKHLIRL